MTENQSLFKISANISLRREYFGGLVFVPATGEILQFNQTGYALVEDARNKSEFRIDFNDLSFWQELKRRGVIEEVVSNDSC